MPGKRSRLRCRHFLTLLAVLLVLPLGGKAQTSRVLMHGTVSETVALSVARDFNHGDVEMSSGNTVRITLSGDRGKSPVIRVPLLVRSNSTFKISAALESQTAELTHLVIENVRPTGALVSPLALNQLSVPSQFDVRGLGANAASAGKPLDITQPMLVVSGPRVSLGGTLTSPNNALEITLLIRLQPEPTGAWSAHLTLVASPGSPVQ